MNTRIFKLYIIKALVVASLMASGAVFLVLAATFTSSRVPQPQCGQWEFAVNIDQYFPAYNKWLWDISHPVNKDVSDCYLGTRTLGYIPVYLPYTPTGKMSGWYPWIVSPGESYYAILAVEASPNLHSPRIIERTRQDESEYYQQILQKFHKAP